MQKDDPPMSNVIAFPSKIRNADFAASTDDVRADKLLAITTRMHDRAMCAMGDAERQDMINDSLDVMRLLFR